MKKEKLYNEFEQLIQRLGLRILRGKGDFAGGTCTVNSEKVVVLNKLKPLEQRLKILVQSVSEYDLEEYHSFIDSQNISCQGNGNNRMKRKSEWKWEKKINK